MLGKQNVHFLHIGKTGGTTFRNQFAASYRKDPSLVLRHNILLSLGSHEMNISEVPSNQLVTFCIREPLELLSSAFYNYHPDYKNYWFDNSKNQVWVSWYQKFPTMSSWVNGLMAKNEIAEEGFSLNMHLSRRLEFYLLSPAIINLLEKRIYFIADTATLDDDLERFAQLSGMQYVSKRLNNSMKPETDELTEAQKNYLKSRFANDFALYVECRRIREKIIESASF